MEDNSVGSGGSGVVEITLNNLNTVLASNDVVLVTFYAAWCRFSSMLMPILDATAEEITKVGFKHGKVTIAKVDCDKDEALGARFKIFQYPSLKVFRYGFPAKSCYRGQRNVEAILDFIKKQYCDPIVEFKHLDELHDLNENKGHVIASLDSRAQAEYDVLRKVATGLHDECEFHVGFSDTAQQIRQPEGQPAIVFRTNQRVLTEPDEPYQGSLLDFEAICTWVQNKSFPLIREITNDKAGQLIVEEFSLLMLLRMREDTESVKKFIEVIRQEFRSQEHHDVAFFTADGSQFENMVHNLKTSLSDLPIIIVAFYRTLYLFPDYNDINIPGTLKQFIQDVFTGELPMHRGFRYKSTAIDKTKQVNSTNNGADTDDAEDNFNLFD